MPVARDTLVNSAINAGCDYIFFVDTDIIFESPTDPNIALNQLYQAINKDPNSKDGKIVSGLYRAKQKHGFTYAAWTKYQGNQENQETGFIAIQEWTGNWIKIDVAGLGCCLIDITVFKNIQRPWFKWDLQGEMSEDFYFFQLATRFGYNTHLFSDVKLSHLGELKVRADGSISIPDM